MSGCAETSVSTQGLKFSIQNSSPLPLATPKNEFKRTRKRGKTRHLNSTPIIQELKDKTIENDNKKKEKKTSIVKKEKTVKVKEKCYLKKKAAVMQVIQVLIKMILYLIQLVYFSKNFIHNLTLKNLGFAVKNAILGAIVYVQA